jgi:hypothetical protein
MNGRVILDDCCDKSSILLNKFASPETDGTKTLDVEAFA